MLCCAPLNRMLCSPCSAVFNSYGEEAPDLLRRAPLHALHAVPPQCFVCRPPLRAMLCLPCCAVFNSYGEEAPDLPASMARGAPLPLPAVAGVFPAFAMLNHSCAPNALMYVLGRAMVVRAAQHIEQVGGVPGHGNGCAVLLLVRSWDRPGWRWRGPDARASILFGMRRVQWGGDTARSQPGRDDRDDDGQ